MTPLKAAAESELKQLNFGCIQECVPTAATLTDAALLIPASDLRRIPSLKGSRSLKTCFKAIVKSFKSLDISEADVALFVVGRQDASPTHTFQLETHAKTSLDEVFALLPLTGLDEDDPYKPTVANRATGVIHLHYDFPVPPRAAPVAPAATSAAAATGHPLCSAAPAASISGAGPGSALALASALAGRSRQS